MRFCYTQDMSLPTFIKLIDPELPMPEFHTSGSAGLDLYSRIDVTLAPKEIKRVPLNVAIKPPVDHWVLLVPRGSLHKKGILPANGIGVIDEDFCGDDDEYQAALYNTLDKPVTIEKGERIMQIVFMPLIRPTIEQVTSMKDPSRGAFGSTGRWA